MPHTYNNNDSTYSQKVKAGKRTYFFDIKQTQAGDYYLVLTESRKDKQGMDGSYKKTKIHLYKEDLNKFIAALQKTTTHIKDKLLPNYNFDATHPTDKQAEAGER